MTIWNQRKWSRHRSLESVTEEGSRKDAGKPGACLRSMPCALGQRGLNGRKRDSKNKSWHLTMPVDTWRVVRIPWFASHRKLTQIDLSKKGIIGLHGWEGCWSGSENRKKSSRNQNSRTRPRWCSGKESACQCRDARDAGLIFGSERSPAWGSGNPVQYSCLGSPMDRGACWATLLWGCKNWTQLS